MVPVEDEACGVLGALTPEKAVVMRMSARHPEEGWPAHPHEDSCQADSPQSFSLHHQLSSFHEESSENSSHNEGDQFSSQLISPMAYTEDTDCGAEVGHCEALCSEPPRPKHLAEKSEGVPPCPCQVPVLSLPVHVPVLCFRVPFWPVPLPVPLSTLPLPFQQATASTGVGPRDVTLGRSADS